MWQFYELLGRFCCGVGEGDVDGSFMNCELVSVLLLVFLVAGWLEVKLKKVFVDDAFSGWYSCQSNLTRPYGKEAPVCIRSNGRAFAHESVVHSVSREVIFL